MLNIKITSRQKTHIVIALAIAIISTITTLHFWPHWIGVGHGTMAGVLVGAGISITEVYLEGE